MKTPRLAAALAAGLLTAPALAEEYTSYHNLEITSPAAPGCRAGMLLNEPASWQSDDGAVVLLTLGRPYDTARDVLVSALLQEGAAVLELVPFACDGRAGGRDAVVASARGALEAMTAVAGAGMVVAIGYGPGGAAVLDVVREPSVGPHYAAAVAMGEGEPAYVLGPARRPEEDAPSRLAALCRALAGIAGGMGLTPDRDRAEAAAGSCAAAIGEGAPRRPPVLPAMSRW